MKVFKKDICEGASDLMCILNSIELIGYERSEVDYIIKIVSPLSTSQRSLTDVIGYLERLTELRNEPLMCKLLALAMCFHFTGNVEKVKKHLKELKSTSVDFKVSEGFYINSQYSSTIDKLWTTFFPITTPYFTGKAIKKRVNLFTIVR